MKSGRASRRSIRYSIFIGALAGSVFSASGAFATEPTPILNQTELEAIGSSDGSRSGNYILNFEGSELALSAPTGSTYVAGIFTGTLDGNRKTLTGLVAPLFNSIYENGPTNSVIKNLDLITAPEGVSGRGILANNALNTNIENVNVTGVLNATGEKVGGIVGTGTNFTDSHATNVTINFGTDYVGGLAGEIRGNISDSTSSGTISGSSFVGGLAGYAAGPVSILESSSSANVTGTGDAIGGLLGWGINSVTVIDGHYSGEVSGRDKVGGLVGESYNGVTLTDITVNADVTGRNYVGGAVGNVAINSDSLISGTSNEITTVLAGSNNLGGVAGSVTGNLEIHNTSVTASINSEGGGNLGGFVGEVLYKTTIEDSKFDGEVSTTTGQYVGGLVGNAADAVIRRSFANSDVTGGANTGGLVGAVLSAEIGGTNSEITESFHKGSVAGLGNTGGLVGTFKPISGVVTNSYNLGSVTGLGENIGGLAGIVWNSTISNSYTNSQVLGKNQTGGLIGQVNSSSISNSFTVGDVATIREYVTNIVSEVTGTTLVDDSMFYSCPYFLYDSLVYGTCAPFTYSHIENVYTDVDRSYWDYKNYTGGLIGRTDNSLIENSFATGDVSGGTHVGGLIGFAAGSVFNSFATGDVIGKSHTVGGLIGHADFLSPLGEIQNSYATGNVSSPSYEVGGLVGYSYFNINNSYASGNVAGGFDSGGFFIGDFVGGKSGGSSITNSFASGTICPDSDLTTSNCSVTDLETIDTLRLSPESPEEPFLISVSSTSNLDPTKWAKSNCINSGNPYLLALSAHYLTSCESSGGTSGGGTVTPPRREKVDREVREVTESRTPEKIEKSIGFKNETPLPKSAPISFVESTEKIDLAKVKVVEIAPTANVKVVAKAGEALQISLKSESKEPVELWIKSPDGSWLLAGVITFDKDGKAILPPLQFKSAGDYSLVLSKPTVDSAKGSAPLNQSGSVLVAVS